MTYSIVGRDAVKLEREDPRWLDYVRTLSRYPGMEHFAQLLTDR